MNDAATIPASFRTSGTNLKRAKTHNHRVVLEIIRTRGPIGRTEISEITSLSRQTVQNIVAELERGGIVVMHAGKASGRGHPGMKVQLKADHAFSLGFHVDRLSVTAIVCDLVGEIVWEKSAGLSAASPDAANARIIGLAEEFRASKPELSDRLFGVGLAAPGPFETVDGTPSGADATNFSEFGSKENLDRLQQALGLPVVLQNDASAAALGEHVYGIGRNFNSFAFVQFGMGLGAGLVLNGALYPGSTKNAGEIGHVCVDPVGPPCTCGNSGCLEKYLSLNALCERLALAPTSQYSVTRIEQLFDEGNEGVREWMRDVAPYMRQMISMIDMMLDPEAIILGGIIKPAFLEALLEHASPLPVPPYGANGQDDRIRIGTSGATAVALGATAAAVDALYAPQVSHLLL
ncbi:MAG: ROK family transcriptional regulator [Roseibium sp.]|uniref:ROK family transcriptional regulator n=1 Tax=Roseibium sp. TaxID=1936156 RepID=UPI001B057A3C|nr:ROK family transcriptional regulator [Roseibium sp.]MBO6511389.1 ROK family transcriptional regulator [Roseibium sp.]MBO6891955.1 ROK family transcriptional regulator [Roseibium sp.]MBO6930030.1 ROK family transcriptional regulator [Roseibium sp.]